MLYHLILSLPPEVAEPISTQLQKVLDGFRDLMTTLGVVLEDLSMDLTYFGFDLAATKAENRQLRGEIK